MQIVYTYRPIEEAFQGVLDRATTQGRTVPVDMAIQSHEGAARAISELHSLYADNPNVHFEFIDNSGPDPKQGTIALTKKDNYRESRDRLYAILEANRSRLPESIYQRAKGGRW